MYSSIPTASVFVLCNFVLAAQGLHQSLFSRQTAKTVELPLYQDSYKSGYFTNISVGTPGSSITVQVDTGSSDLWVFSDQAVCQVRRGCSGGEFNQGSSSSFHNIGTDAFFIEYGDGTRAQGDLVTEKVQFGGATVSDLTMAVVTAARGSTQLYGIMGIGYPGGESVRAEGPNEYLNLPYALTAQGVISEPVYSLFLNDVGAQSGTLLFGGIDTDKIDGELTVLDILFDARDPRLLVPLTSLTITGSNGDSSPVSLGSGSGSSTSTPALLDSGTTAVLLPESAVEDIYQQFGANDQGIVPCSIANSGQKLTYQFGGSSGATVRVDISEMIQRSQNVCVLLVTVANDLAVLGDSFLRSAYVAYDLANAQIGIGQAKFNSPSENVQPLTASASVSNIIGTVPAASIGPGTGFGGGSLPGNIVGATANMQSVSNLPTAIPHGSSQASQGSLPTQISRGSSSMAASTTSGASRSTVSTGAGSGANIGAAATTASPSAASNQGSGGTRTTAPTVSPPKFTNAAVAAMSLNSGHVLMMALGILNAGIFSVQL